MFATLSTFCHQAGGMAGWHLPRATHITTATITVWAVLVALLLTTLSGPINTREVRWGARPNNHTVDHNSQERRDIGDRIGPAQSPVPTPNQSSQAKTAKRMWSGRMPFAL